MEEPFSKDNFPEQQCYPNEGQEYSVVFQDPKSFMLRFLLAYANLFLGTLQGCGVSALLWLVVYSRQILLPVARACPTI